MPALSAPDAATWRSHPYSVRGYLFLLQPDAVFKALVNEPSGVTYPVDQFDIDNVSLGLISQAQYDRTIIIGSALDLDDRGRTRNRMLSQGVTPTIFTTGSSRGDHDGEVDLIDNSFVTVWDDYRVSTRNPEYDNATGAQAKDYGISKTPNQAQPPIAVVGPGVADFVDTTTSKLRVSLDASSSYVIHPSATSNVYLWEIPASASLITGTLTSPAITVDFAPGFYWVTMKLSDDYTPGGASRFVWRRIPIFAAERTGANAPIYNFDVTRRTLAQDGQIAVFNVKEDIDIDDYPDGTLVMYWEEENYGDGTVGSLAGPAGREQVKFIGWLQRSRERLNAGNNGLIKSVELECLDVAGRMRNIPGFEQFVEYVAVGADSDWVDLQEANMDRFMHYLLHWHCTADNVADFHVSGTGATYDFVSKSADDGASMWDQIAQQAQAIGTGHVLTCDQRGVIRTEPDPMLQASGSRTSTVIISLDEDDIAEMHYDYERPPRVHWHREAAIVAGSTTPISTVFSIAPGEAPGIGLNASEMNKRIVQNQAELNTRTGNQYARDNSRYGILNVTLAHPGDAGIEPAFMEWVQITLSADYAAQRGLTWTNQRFLVLEVDYVYDAAAGTRVQRLRLEHETEGYDGVTLEPEEYGA